MVVLVNDFDDIESLVRPKRLLLLLLVLLLLVDGVVVVNSLLPLLIWCFESISSFFIGGFGVSVIFAGRGRLTRRDDELDEPSRVSFIDEFGHFVNSLIRIILPIPIVLPSSRRVNRPN